MLGCDLLALALGALYCELLRELVALASGALRGPRTDRAGGVPRLAAAAVA